MFKKLKYKGLHKIQIILLHHMQTTNCLYECYDTDTRTNSIYSFHANQRECRTAYGKAKWSKL